MLDEPRKTCTVISNDESDKNFPTLLSQDYIYDSIKNQVPQRRKDYIIKKVEKAADIKINLNPQDTVKLEQGKFIYKPNENNSVIKKSSKFSKEEDDFIMDVIRRNPHLRSTHSFFERISLFLPLAGHTGNSIRYRYRKALAKEVKYYYSVDPITHELVLDPKTNLPIKVYEAPALLKSQYTAEEDYNLCKIVLKYFNERSQRNLSAKQKQNVTVPESVYQSVSFEFPTHSAMAYRDRYRKFACKYGLQNYIDYYENCAKEKTKPLPMKNLSSRFDRKDVPRPTLSDEIIKIEDEESDEGEQEETPEVKNTDIEDKKVLRDSTSSNNNNVPIEPARKKLKLDTSKIKLDETDDTSIAVAAAAIANIHEQAIQSKPKKSKSKKANKKSSRADEIDFMPNDQAVIEEHEDTDRSANLFEQELVKIVQNEINHPNEDEVVVVDDVDDVDDGLMDYKQLLEIDPEPLKDRETNGMIDSLIIQVADFFDNYVEGTSYELFKDLNEMTGISLFWLSYWFDCSCGMLPIFHYSIVNYLQTGELILDEYPGFWTEKDDELLKKDPDNLDLLKLHGSESVMKRKSVLFDQQF